MPRCAIYTRKSTDEGLEQDFNSLDAQREACEAYIRSQKHEGWRLIPEHFDDGGHSGGTMDRPALARLLDAIKQAQVDVVVVYKVDRLTRALADFAKIVELFDGHGVSFVSVTQQFNTTTSMGRLTLNVLLSFAQFEREVTAERIRDKIAASKQKGMWMGGPVPLGYDVLDRKLVINESEARTVRQIFELYFGLGTVQRLIPELNRRGILTKRRFTDKGESGGKPFTRGALYAFLSNPLYAGQTPHKGATYPGQHEAIIDPALWESVRNRLAENAPLRRSRTNGRSSALLAGLVFDETGDRLTPTHATKAGRRYRYYVSNRLILGTGEAGDGWRIPARELERGVITLLSDFLNDHHRLIALMNIEDQPATTLGRVDKLRVGILEQLKDIGSSAAYDAIRQVVRRVDLSLERIAVSLDWSTLARMLGVADLAQTSPGGESVEISALLTMRRRGVEARLVIHCDNKPLGQPDPALSRLVAKAHVWFDQIASGEVASVREIARREKVHECDVSWSLRLAFLSPKVVEIIVSGRQPIELHAKKLRTLHELPADWLSQDRMLMHS